MSTWIYRIKNLFFKYFKTKEFVPDSELKIVYGFYYKKVTYNKTKNGEILKNCILF